MGNGTEYNRYLKGFKTDMSIQEKISLPGAVAKQLNFHPGEDGVTSVLIIKAPLTIESSKVLGCEERFFTINERPYADYLGRITLTHVATDCKVMIGEVCLLPDKIWKFSCGLEKDSKPSVELRIHMDSRWRKELLELFVTLNNSEFQIDIIALQQHLFLDENSPASSGEGTKVDMSAKQTSFDDQDDDESHEDPDSVTRCESCDAGSPLDISAGTHEDGNDCAFRTAAAASIDQMGTGTLASTLQVVGGTSAAAKKERKTRHGKASIN